MVNVVKSRFMAGLTITFMMIASFLTPFADVTHASETISVEEAIKHNEGHAAVEGYVVGHTVSSGHYRFSGNFANDYNIAIADEKEETSPENILPVQIPASFRDQFGLKTNPHLIGKKLIIEGERSTYFNSPGLKSVQSITFSGGDAPPAKPEIKTIAEARKLLNETVKITGIVTADQAAVGGGKLSTFIQDETAGINIYSAAQDDFPELKEGMSVSVTGKITTYKGLTEIVPVPSGIEVTGEGAVLPDPVPLTIKDVLDQGTAVKYEGRLVKMKGFIETKPDAPAGGGYNITMIDENYHPLTLRVMEQTNAADSIEQGQWYEITGILSRYDTVQLLPRKQEDLRKLDGIAHPPPLLKGNTKALSNELSMGIRST